MDIPEFLIEEIKEYDSRLYKLDPEQQLFEINADQFRRVMLKRIQQAGVKQIRVHDLRRSHASLLINLGANPVLLAERLGHESSDITSKTYSHLFPQAS